ncbi:hypothetical protein, partial [Staphylococcus saprophyticus]|uniref:hypothetical protein n=1 Tax=Staphylococcus saprophyticus TaxID=29385 RepID=UPI0016423DEA
NIEGMGHEGSLTLVFGKNEMDMRYRMLRSDGGGRGERGDLLEVWKMRDENMKDIMERGYKRVFVERIGDIRKGSAGEVGYA